MKGQRRLFVWGLLIISAIGYKNAGAQYMYLDADGDSLNTAEDRLSSTGETVLDVWLDTSHNRDGSLASCGTGEALSINSYEVILHADGGTVSWGGFSNYQLAMTTSFGAAADSTDYYRGFGGGVSLSPGRFRLASVVVTATSGMPRIEVAESTPLSAVYSTSFGSQCPGLDQDNTLKLGSDWMDTDGVDAPNLPPSINAPQFLGIQAGEYVTVTADATDSLAQTAPEIAAQGYPASLSLNVIQTGVNSARASLGGYLGMNDAGLHSIVWTATDADGLTNSSTTMMDVSSQSQADGATILGYTTTGPGPIAVTPGANGFDATIGPWGGPPFPNGPCGECVMFPSVLYSNQVEFEIDVGTGGSVSFTYELEQTGTPFISEYMTIYLATGTGNDYFRDRWGNPEPCWGTVWRSSRITRTVNLTPYANSHVFLRFVVTGHTNCGTESQGRIYSIAIDPCGEPPLSPLSAQDQVFEDDDNHWDEANLTPEMQTALNCFRTKVQQLNGNFDISEGSAYRTKGYQAHLREVWDKYYRLRNKSSADCQGLLATLANEKNVKHHLVTEPGHPDRSLHAKGLAFDATVTGVDQDSLACSCGLYRPYKEISKKNKILDPVHFVLRPCP